MDYQLVLQFDADALDDQDDMDTLKDLLIEELDDTAEMDDDDWSEEKVNLFFLTPDPKATFRLLKPVLERREHLQEVTAAYRETDGDQYTVIWPEKSKKAFAVD
jgi:hypothetical protein